MSDKKLLNLNKLLLNKYSNKNTDKITDPKMLYFKNSQNNLITNELFNPHISKK